MGPRVRRWRAPAVALSVAVTVLGTTAAHAAPAATRAIPAATVTPAPPGAPGGRPHWILRRPAGPPSPAAQVGAGPTSQSPPGPPARGSTTTVPHTDTAPAAVTVAGGELLLHGRPSQMTGVNAPQAATYYPVNAGCGAQIDLDALFGALAPDSLVRVGFGQDRAIDPATRQRDWRALDRVVAAAERSPTHPHLIISLTSQAGVCGDGHWLDSSWYTGGYHQVYDDWHDGWPRVSYWDYLHELVPRYAGSLAVAVWEPAGEPEASDCEPGYHGPDCYGHKVCPPDATAILRRFFDVVGTEVKRMDPAHLVASGVIGGGQCGWGGGGSAVIHASPGLDLATFHDYGSDAVPLPAELAQRITEARSIGKPILDEEVGINGRDVAGCTSLATRGAEMAAKERAAFAAGASAFLPWDYAEGAPDQRCDTRIRPGDPVMTMLSRSGGA